MDKLTGSILVASLMLSGVMAIKAQAQTENVNSLGGGSLRENVESMPSTEVAVAPALATTFNCVHYGSGFATVARRGDRTTPPIITWNITLGRYTPQLRCNMVSQRLTQLVAQNGGKLKNLQLLVGSVSHQIVVCAVNSLQPSCNSSNMLFTLRPDNAKRSDQILATLNEFPVFGTGATVDESSGTNSLPLERLEQFLQPEATHHFR